MTRVHDFLKKASVYYLATVEGDQPRVRPFGTINQFEGKLYIQTGKIKPTSHQLAANPKAEICAFTEGAWIRVACELVEDDRYEAKKSMLDAYPNLRSMYDENDGNTQVFYMKNAVATFCAFGKAPEVVEFMKNHSTAEILKNTELWGEDLSMLLCEVEKYVNK